MRCLIWVGNEVEFDAASTEAVDDRWYVDGNVSAGADVSLAVAAAAAECTGLVAYVDAAEAS